MRDSENLEGFGMSINGKEKIMLVCMAVLMIFMASIFLRLGTRLVLVKKLHMDNALTQVVLFDLFALQSKGGGMDDPPINKKNMHWAEKYPFRESEQTDWIVKLKA